MVMEKLVMKILYLVTLPIPTILMDRIINLITSLNSIRQQESGYLKLSKLQYKMMELYGVLVYLVVFILEIQLQKLLMVILEIV